MPDLSDDLRTYFDELASRVERNVPLPSSADGHLTSANTGDDGDSPRLDNPEGEVAELGPPPPKNGRVPWLAVAAVLLLIGGVVAVVAMARPDIDGRVITGTTTTAVSEDLDWLTPYGPEVTAPPIPDGWNVLDFELLRFAVPADWQVPSPCQSMASSSGVVILPIVEPSKCMATAPTSVLRIARGSTDPMPGSETRVGTLAATVFTEACGEGCETWYQLDAGYNLSITGPLSDQVYATFTDSGARRALQDGPLTDASGWRTISYDGVGLRVPGSWEVVDVADRVNPDACGGPMFPSDKLPTAYLGVSEATVSCAATTGLDLGSGDGVWVRPMPEGWTDRSFTPVTEGTIGGLDVTVIKVSADQRDGPDPALDLLVRTGTETWWVSVGVGSDASTARSILRSLHHPSEPATPTTTTTSVEKPEDRIALSVTLWHCGVEPVTANGRVWEVPDTEKVDGHPDLPLDSTNTPSDWVGSGMAIVADDEMTYTDEGGEVVAFVPDDGRPPSPCG